MATSGSRIRKPMLQGGRRLQRHSESGSSPNSLPSEAARPLITVITVTYNAASNLEQTITSVINQSYNNIEYIVVDGGSTDETLEIIQRYEAHIEYWVSESDDGIYDAMNKGILLARGNFIVMLNASDWYGKCLISQVVTDIRDDARPNTIYFTNYQLFHEDIDVYEKRECFVAPWKGMTISHQSMFVPAHVYHKIGVYNSDYALAADFDFFLRAHVGGVQFFRIDTYDVIFRAGGRSLSNMPTSIAEATRAIRLAYGPLSFPHLKFLVIQNMGLIYYYYFKLGLTFVFGKHLIDRIRKFRRKLTAVGR